MCDGRVPERERMFRILTERGPGDRPCGQYMRSWAQGERDSAVMTHINECALCGPVVHGDGVDFFGSIDEEVARRVAIRRRAGRRRFLAASAAAGILLSVGLALTSWPTRTASPGSKITKRLHDQLDQILSTSGRVAIDAKFAGSDAETRCALLWWIASRKHTALYDIFATGAIDPNVDVRHMAIGCAEAVPAVDMKSYLPQLQAAAAAETDPEVKVAFDILVKKVTVG